MSWQTANFSIPIGRGLGQIGFKAAVPGTAGIALVSAGAATDPVFGTISPAGGGTGLTSFAVGDLLYADTTSSLARLADVAVGRVLISGGVSTAPAYSTNVQLGASGTAGSVVLGNATSGLLTLQPVTGALGTVTVSIPAATDTLVGKATTDELTNKTLASSVGKGTWTASGTWTLPAITLGGTVSGGGNNLNNIVIGAVTPLAGSFTTVTATGAINAGAGSLVGNTGRGGFQMAADGVMTLLDTAGTAFTRLQFGGTTSSFPALKRTTVALNARLADDSADATITFKTQSPGDNTTNGASTAFVTAAVAAATAGVASLNGQTGALVSYFAPQGRLTLASATPVMTSSQAAKTTIYYTPYVGNIVPIYDGSNMVPTVVAEISVATTDTTKSPAAIGASKVNDWFVWNDGGTIRIGHGPDWTNDTTRSAGTALVLVSGIYLNNASITNGPAASRGTYVGTTRSDGSSQLNYIFGAAASGGTAGALNVWNAYNRVLTTTTVTDSGTTYTYTTATTRQARASAGNQVSFVAGLAEDGVLASYVVSSHTANTANAQISIGLGFDSTSAYASGVALGIYQIAGPSGIYFYTLTDAQTWNPGIGLHTISANERGDGTNANTFNDNSASRLNVTLMN